MKRKGFTLIELLVVVAIVGVLVGLLLPAVQMARAASRRTACMNNLYQMGRAAHVHEMNKGSLPGWNNSITQDSGTTLRVNWVVKMLPEMERRDVYDYIKAQPTTSVPNAPFIDIMKCPSSPPLEIATQVDYAINGASTEFMLNSGGSQNAGDAVAFDAIGNSNVRPHRCSLDFVSSGDGTSNTLLFSEQSAQPVRRRYVDDPNSLSIIPTHGQAGNWSSMNALYPLIFTGPANVQGQGVTIAQTFVLGNEIATESPFYRFPNSLHGDNKVVVCMADGSTRTLSMEIHENLYTQLLTSHSRFVNGWYRGRGLPLMDSSKLVQ